MIRYRVLGTLLAWAREAQNWTQDQIASRIPAEHRLGKTTLSRIETGQWPALRLNALAELCTAYGVKREVMTKAQNYDEHGVFHGNEEAALWELTWLHLTEDERKRVMAWALLRPDPQAQVSASEPQIKTPTGIVLAPTDDDDYYYKP